MRVKLIPVTLEQIEKIDKAALELHFLFKVTGRAELEPLIANLTGMTRLIQYSQDFVLPEEEPKDAP